MDTFGAENSFRSSTPAYDVVHLLKKGTRMNNELPGIFEKLFDWIVFSFAFVVSWLFRRFHTRLVDLEKSYVKKEELEHYQQRAEIDRREIMESISRLFDRIDDLKTLLLKRN